MSQVSDITQLTDEIDSLDIVERTEVQKLISSEYEANGQESDSEGRLVVYEPVNYAYRIFLDDLSGYQTGEAVLHSGKLYAPISLLSLLPLMLLLLGFIFLKVRKIGEITTVEIIRGTMGKASKKKRDSFPVRSMGLSFFLALRQLAAGKRRYLNVGVSALLLVFFALFMGYVDSWLGEDGKGLMDAFNPADLHIAAQPMGEATSVDVERMIMEYTDIKDLFGDGSGMYHEDFCCILPKGLNTLLANAKKHYKEGETPDNVLPLGVSYNSKTGKYTSSIQFTGAEKPIPLSEWDTAEEAFEEYRVLKRADILIVAAKYKNSIPDYIYDRLLKVEVKLY